MVRERKHARALYIAGRLTVAAIAAAVGVALSTVDTWRREEGWPRRRTWAVPRGARRRAHALYTTGERNLSAIARAVGVSREAVRRWRRADHWTDTGA